MAEDNAPENEVVTPKPRAPRKRATPAAKATTVVESPTEEAEVNPVPKPRKPRKTAAQKAAEAAEAERLAAEKEAEAKRPLEEDVVAPVISPEPVIEDSPEPLVEEVPVEEETPVEEEKKDEPEHGGVDELKAMFDEVDPDPESEPVVHPLSVRGVVLAPGYWQGFEGPYGRLNVFAWLGFIFAFVFFPLGFVFSLLGLANAKAVPTDKFGKAIGWIGLAVSGIAGFVTLLWLIFLPFSLLLSGPVAHPFY